MEQKEQKNESEKSCQNCGYYSQHYSKQGTQFQKVFCGHCTNKNNKRFKAVLCDSWENDAQQKEKRQELLKEKLIQMSQQLNEITIMFKEDKNIK